MGDNRLFKLSGIPAHKPFTQLLSASKHENVEVGSQFKRNKTEFECDNSSMTNTLELGNELRNLGELSKGHFTVRPSESDIANMHHLIMPTMTFTNVITNIKYFAFASVFLGVNLLGRSGRGGGGTQLGQQEYSLHGGRYASCVHAGGLSCFFEKLN